MLSLSKHGLDPFDKLRVTSPCKSQPILKFLNSKLYTVNFTLLTKLRYL